MASPERLHLMGIGGAGMSGIAIHAVSQGFDVSGCDVSDANTEALQQLGIRISKGHDPAHCEDFDLLGVTTAVSDAHPEVVAARDSAKPVLRRNELLRRITAAKRVISVTGTHGKTTTSAMVAHILNHCGADPSYLVGGLVPTLGGGAGVGNGDAFVLEADESDASFLGPETEIGVVTNLEADHLDFYGSYEKLKNAFTTFATNAKQVVVCADSADAIAAVKGSNAISYGQTTQADVPIRNVTIGADRSTATISIADIDVHLSLSVPGVHAISNATAAVVAASIYGIDANLAAQALETFVNVDRRFTYRGTERDVVIIDDYAHLPTEISATIAAARASDPKRIVVVFQPHRYSRTEALWQEFSGSFVGADEVVVTDIFPAGEQSRPGVSGELIADAVRKAHPEARLSYVPERDALVTFLSDRLQPGDMLLTLGAGDITNLSNELIDAWRQS